MLLLDRNGAETPMAGPAPKALRPGTCPAALSLRCAAGRLWPRSAKDQQVGVADAQCDVCLELGPLLPGLSWSPSRFHLSGTGVASAGARRLRRAGYAGQLRAMGRYSRPVRLCAGLWLRRGRVAGCQRRRQDAGQWREAAHLPNSGKVNGFSIIGIFTPNFSMSA